MLRFSAALSTIILLHGCSIISREAGYPGGNVGYVADRYALFAQGQDQQVNRYLISLALLAPLIAETVESQSEAKLSAERIKDLYQNIEKLENASQKCSLAEIPKKNAQPEHIKFDDGCDVKAAGDVHGTALSFESISFGVNKSLNDAVKQAFDNLEIRNNVNQVLALSPTELLKTILKARRLIPVFQRYLATYRDISIVFGLSVADSCSKRKAEETANEALDKLCVSVAESFSDLVNRTRNPNDEIASDERPIRDVFKAGEKALNGGLNWQLSKIHRTALLQHVNQACKRIDALASIDTTDYKGCTIDLNDEKNTATAETTNIDETTQAAVMGIINNATK